MSARHTVAAVIIPGMAPLDLFGPIQAFNVAFGRHTSGKPDTGLPLYDVFSIGDARGRVPTGGRRNGPAVDVLHTFSDAPPYDILLVPGGLGVRQLVGDKRFLDGLRLAAARAAIVASVCTGAALIAEIGLLDGKRATTNKTAWDWVTERRPAVRWECCPRWVDEIGADGRGAITSAGVSAGTDMALALIARLDGQMVAENAERYMEWDWVTDPDDDRWGRELCDEGPCSEPRVGPAPEPSPEAV